MVHVHDDSGADNNRVAKLVHNAGNNDDPINQCPRDHDCSTDVDNRAADYNHRRFYDRHRCGDL
ncbi:hypothetical protein AAVH_26830 [Aphelenchoides avenae]|nr:hypothetical protein AAVH_26830 [Aphelenchus avenae]